MSENIRIGYINLFCHHAHEKINEAYEAMCDEQEAEVIKVLSDLKKFINETIKDYQHELTSNKNIAANRRNYADDSSDDCRTGSFD